MARLIGLVAQHWWAIVLRGVVAILFGIMAIAWPGLTLASLVLLFAVFALADGVAGIIMGIKDYGDRERWWATLLGGIVSLCAGLVALAWPGLTALTVLMVIAFWAIVRGVMDIAAAIWLRKVIEGEGWLALSGAFSIVFGLLLVFFPGTGAMAMVLWIAAYAMVLGVLLITTGFRLRGFKHHLGV